MKSDIRRYFIGILVLAFGFFAVVSLRAEEPFDAETKAAMSEIRSSSFFAFGGVGEVGSISPGDKGLCVLIQKKARAALLKLTNGRNENARLYGLAGLRYLNTPDYKKAAEAMMASKASVETFQGCMAATLPVSTVTRLIINGDYNEQIKYRLEESKKKSIYERRNDRNRVRR